MALSGKVESLKMDLIQKEKEIYNITQTMEVKSSNLSKIEESLNDLRHEYEDERKTLLAKHEKMTKDLSSRNDELVQKNINYEKKLALSDLENTFYSKRIEEISNHNDNINKKVEDRAESLKAEHFDEIQHLTKKLNEEVKLQREAYESKRKSYKELEASSHSRISDLEKEKSALIEKLNTTEASLAKIERKRNNEIQTLTQELERLKSLNEKGNKFQVGEVDRLKKKAYDLELENADIQSNYEKDKALWSGKFTFMDQQNKELKSENSELQANFDIMFQRFQNSRNSDKEETLTNQNALIASIEQKYTTVIQECNDKHNHQTFEFHEKISKLEREVKLKDEKNAVELENKSNLQSLYEKKMSEMGEGKSKLEYDLEAAKDQADFRIGEYKESFEKEKDKWKGKVHEHEVKNRDGESRRTALIFEHEKERTRWNLEKEHLINQKNDVLESLDKLEKKKETYLRENERLRNENKKNRRLLGNAPNGLANLMDGCRFGGYQGIMNTSKYAERSFRKEEM